MHRFAPKLNIHQLRGACGWLSAESAVTTDSFVDYLRSQRLGNVILPRENDALATELNLRPKRGVLLYGPPGIGRTSMGRARAHRLKGKVLMIDRTFISGSSSFYSKVFEDGQERGFYRYLLTKLDGLEGEAGSCVCVILTAMRLDDRLRCCAP